MELSQDDFKTLLFAEGGWGPVNKEAAERDLFHCHKCSTEGHKVFHNVNGIRPHVSKQDLQAKVGSIRWGFD